MISANDVLHVISEIHQYSVLLLELRDSTTYGISHSKNGRLSYFRYEGKLNRSERRTLVDQVCSGEAGDKVRSLEVEQLLREIEGKKAKHIWLETVEAERRELGFMSMAELKSFLRTSRTH